MSAPRGTVLVIGPFAETAGGVVTFQKNLVERSRLKEQWRFVRHSNSRPPKEDVPDYHRYGALFNAGPRSFLVGGAVATSNRVRPRRKSAMAASFSSRGSRPCSRPTGTPGSAADQRP